jgi:hypothetical protein
VRHSALLVLTLSLASGAPGATSDWRSELARWRSERAATLAEDDGWLSVVGLFWLEEGQTSFGSGPDIGIPLRPPLPELAGHLELRDGSVRVWLAPEVEAGLEMGADGWRALRSDAAGEPDRLRFGEQRLYVIDRGGRLGVRLIDGAAPARERFEGLAWYPPGEEWRIRGRFVRHPEPRTLSIADVTGGTIRYESPGVVAFEVEGREVELHPVLSGREGSERLFFIFRDATSGRETYGAGRFMYAPLPEDDVVELDFNRAYSPPCAFTAYATCPLPPRVNWLDVAIEAGEKDPEFHY